MIIITVEVICLWFKSVHG